MLFRVANKLVQALSFARRVRHLQIGGLSIGIRLGFIEQALQLIRVIC
jgi:hypothetical protein